MSEAIVSASEPKGIGGWLILPAIALIISPIRMAIQFVNDMLPALDPEIWAMLTTEGSAVYDPLWAAFIVFELIANTIMFGVGIVLLILFFRESKRVPKLYIGWLLLNLAVQVIDQLMANQIPLVAAQADSSGMRELLRAFFGSAIWIPYFLKSVRVRNTFVK